MNTEQQQEYKYYIISKGTYAMEKFKTVEKQEVIELVMLG